MMAGSPTTIIVTAVRIQHRHLEARHAQLRFHRSPLANLPKAYDIALMLARMDGPSCLHCNSRRVSIAEQQAHDSNRDLALVSCLVKSFHHLLAIALIHHIEEADVQQSMPSGFACINNPARKADSRVICKSEFRCRTASCMPSSNFTTKSSEWESRLISRLDSLPC